MLRFVSDSVLRTRIEEGIRWIGRIFTLAAAAAAAKGEERLRCAEKWLSNYATASDGPMGASASVTVERRDGGVRKEAWEDALPVESDVP